MHPKCMDFMPNMECLSVWDWFGRIITRVVSLVESLDTLSPTSPTQYLIGKWSGRSGLGIQILNFNQLNILD